MIKVKNYLSVIIALFFALTLLLIFIRISGKHEKPVEKDSISNELPVNIEQNNKDNIEAIADNDAKQEQVIPIDLPDDADDLPQPELHELIRNKPTVQLLLSSGDDLDKRSEYAFINSNEEISKIIEEWRLFRRYNLGRFVKSEDLLISAMRLAAIRDENWPIANMNCAQLKMDLTYLRESAQLYHSIINEEEIEVDESIRLDAMFKLALLEYGRPISNYWWETKDNLGVNNSITEPARQAYDVAIEYFRHIIENTHPKDDINKLSKVFLEASNIYGDYLKSNPRADLNKAKLLNDFNKFQTTAVLGRELYESNLNQAISTKVVRNSNFLKSEDFDSKFLSLSLDDRSLWASYAGWELHKRRAPDRTIALLEPLLTEMHSDDPSYAEINYYVAYAYNSLGMKDKVKDAILVLTEEGFDFQEMPPNMKVFFQGFLKANSED